MFSGKEFSIHVVPKFERNFVIYKSMVSATLSKVPIQSIGT